MLIAADVGGTHTRLGLFAPAGSRPRPISTREYDTQQFASFRHILALFVDEVSSGQVDAAAIGVAGPIVQQRARLTNVAWEVSAADVAAQLGTSRVRLLNDLEAMATAIPVLRADELETLQAGAHDPDGNAAVIAAGTGLGEAYLPRIDGRFRVLASEAGHTDFAARTERELALVRMLREDYGRASLEHVLSGPGLRNLHRFTHPVDRACIAVPDPSSDGAAAQMSQSGLQGRCPHCLEALTMFAEALGAEAGNLGLRGTATAGVYIGGGIAPRILPALRADGFLGAFLDKAPMHALVARMPVHVILNIDAGLLGAAVAAHALAAASPQ
jgi:glucokinase